MSITAEHECSQEFEPPQEVVIALGNDRLLTFIPYESQMIDVMHLSPPLLTELDSSDDPMTTVERQELLEYTEKSERDKHDIWDQVQTFIAEASVDRSVESDRDILHLAFNEYIQNAFRHGEFPLHVWVGVVEARTSDTPDSLGYRVLIGVQDLNPKWGAPDTQEGLLDHFRGLDLVRALSVATWQQPDERRTSKWVWALI